ncbi:MAG: 30S ribosomal protein S17 [Candidatus Shikimatogenerans bostrichidophilus]|nr:MAG: 30S ribosomal protein S17 [Candidatus Shikimatogenerans bostrichidophilus]
MINKINIKLKKGIIISDKMNKTRIVLYKKRIIHKKYKKIIFKNKKFYAHDEKNLTKIGDNVVIMKVRPLSKTKSWIIKQII